MYAQVSNKISCKFVDPGARSFLINCKCDKHHEKRLLTMAPSLDTKDCLVLPQYSYINVGSSYLFALMGVNIITVCLLILTNLSKFLLDSYIIQCNSLLYLIITTGLTAYISDLKFLWYDWLFIEVRITGYALRIFKLFS